MEETKTAEETLKEKAVKAVDYKRQLALFGKQAADNVLQMWMLGYDTGRISVGIEKLDADLKQGDRAIESIKAHKKTQEELTEQQSSNAELQAWKESEIKTTLPLFEMMHSHPEMKIGDSCIQKSIQFICERDELKKQKADLVEALTRIAMRSDDDDPFESDQTIALKALSNTPPKN